ncbi:MAG: hypothetical protein LAO08_01420 [Acidobacteriia bacterium]|nr:hypothetical protein [Terriglobia bacterium]
MADIKHMIQVNAAPPAVFPLVATAAGFSQWWAADVTEDKATGNVELGFFNRATVYGLHPIQIAAPKQAHWSCHTGKEWSGTRLLFDLEEQKGKRCFDSFTPAGRRRRIISFPARRHGVN